MDYENHYRKLIERAKHRTLDCYTERHHVIPKCLGGSNGRDNIVELTAEEHYVAHQLLVKIHPEHSGLVFACVRMTAGNDHRTTNKLYGWLRKKNAVNTSAIGKRRLGPKNGSFGRHWFCDPETGLRGKFLLGENPTGWERGKTPKPFCCDCGVKLEKRRKRCEECHKLAMSCMQNNHKATREQKVGALQRHNKIRPALIELGLSTAGWHYRKMMELAKEYNIPVA